MKHFFVKVCVCIIILVHFQDGTAEKTTAPSAVPIRASNDFKGPFKISGEENNYSRWKCNVVLNIIMKKFNLKQ